MVNYLLDSSAVSKYLRAIFSENGLLFMDSVLGNGATISVITKIELLSWNTDDAAAYQNTETFVENADLILLTDEIVAQTIALRKKHKIKTPDAIIAATALVQKLTLITDNEKDFANIKKLKVVNPDKI